MKKKNVNNVQSDYNKEIIMHNVNDIEQEIFQVFNEIMSEKEISLYKSSLLAAKLPLLYMAFVRCLDQLKYLNNQAKNVYLKKSLFLYTMNLVNFLLVSFVPPVGFVSTLITLKGFIKNLSNVKKENCVAEINIVTQKLNKAQITFDNCYTMLNARTVCDLSKVEIADIDLQKIDIANKVIGFPNVKNIIESLPEDIQKLVIQLLQDTLNTEEEDLKKLINLLVEQNILENLEQGEKLTRVSKKSSKFSEK